MIIRKIAAVFLLLLFAFCITPKMLLHELIADHKDTPFTSNNSSSQQFEYSGFRCNCDNLVVESPFVNYYITQEVVFPKFNSNHSDFFATNPVFSHSFYFELRGPPSAA
jgi:hypothetical protein